MPVVASPVSNKTDFWERSDLRLGKNNKSTMKKNLPTDEFGEYLSTADNTNNFLGQQNSHLIYKKKIDYRRNVCIVQNQPRLIRGTEASNLI
jgi:hypothetical protein